MITCVHCLIIVSNARRYGKILRSLDYHVMHMTTPTEASRQKAMARNFKFPTTGWPVETEECHKIGKSLPFPAIRNNWKHQKLSLRWWPSTPAFGETTSMVHLLIHELKELFTEIFRNFDSFRLLLFSLSVLKYMCISFWAKLIACTIIWENLKRDPSYVLALEILFHILHDCDWNIN